MIKTNDGSLFTTVVVEFPSDEVAETFVSNPGDEGYHLYEILFPLIGTLKSVTIAESNIEASDKDTVLRWNLLSLDMDTE
jgi:hypothetical protein